MKVTRQFLLFTSICLAASLAGPVAGQTLSYSNGETKTESYTDEFFQLVVPSGSATHSGVFSGVGRIEKSGAGTLTLSGVNSYDEATYLLEGTLIGTNASAFGVGAIFISGGTLRQNGSYTIPNGLNITGAATVGGSVGAGDVVFYSNGVSLSTGGANVTLTSANTNRVHFDGQFFGSVGQLVIAGTNGGGIGDTNSRVFLGYNGSHSFTGGVTIDSGGLLQLTSDLPAATVTNNGGIWLASATGNSDTFTLGGLSGSGVVRVIMNDSGQTATLDVGGNNENTTFSGELATGYTGNSFNGAIALTKSGTGTLTLSGSNSLTGPTVVTNGSLVVDSYFGSPSVTVQTGATLGGSGTLAGFTTLASGAALSPGSSPGTLTFTNGLTLNSGSILNFELGTISDLIAVTGGTLTGPSSGTVTLNLSNSGGFAAGNYTLINYATASGTSNFGINDFVFGATIPGFTYSLSLAGSTLQLSAAAIPEPSTYAALFGAAVLGLAVWRKRRR